MIQITAISNEYKQEFMQILENGEAYKIYIYFIPIDKTESNTQLWTGNWYMDLEYNNIKIQGRKIVVSLDLFDDYQNILPFGIFVQGEDEIEPSFLDIFNLDLIKIFIISKEDKILLQSIFN